MKLTVLGSWAQFVPPLRRLEPFTTHGSLSGRPGRAGAGYLPREYHDSLFAPGVDYVVLSYATPIAWHNGETASWTMPEVKYSVTTSRQQGRIRTALSVVADPTY